MTGNQRYLLVDDSKLARMALRAVLKEIAAGAEVREASSAEAAFQQLSDAPADVVFMDYNMPGLNGLAAATAIRTQHPSTAIALVTANGQDAILREAAALQISFIAKPVRREEVAHFIARL